MHSLKPVLKECLHAHFIQQLLTDVENKSCGDYFLICKFESGFDNYLSKLSEKNRINLSKFRCSNMELTIETGRW